MACVGCICLGCKQQVGMLRKKTRWTVANLHAAERNAMSVGVPPPSSCTPNATECHNIPVELHHTLLAFELQQTLSGPVPSPHVSWRWDPFCGPEHWSLKPENTGVVETDIQK